MKDTLCSCRGEWESGGQGRVIRGGEGGQRCPGADTIERCSRPLAHVCLALTFPGPWDWQSHVSEPWGGMEDHEGLSHLPLCL